MARKSPEKKSETIKKEKTSLESKSEKNKKNVDLTEFDESEEPEENESVHEENSEDEEEASDSEQESEEVLDPNVKKLLDYACSKQIISWDEITEILTPEFVNSPKMEEVLQLLTKNNIQVMEEDSLLDDEENEEEDDEGALSDSEDILNLMKSTALFQMTRNLELMIRFGFICAKLERKIFLRQSRKLFFQSRWKTGRT